MLELLITPEVMNVTRPPLVTAGYIFQLILSLAIVLALIWVTTKYLLPKLQLPSTGKMIEVLDRVGLEPQVTSYVISVAGKKYLVVVSSKAATLIDKIEGGA